MSTRRPKAADGKAEDATRQPEQVKAYRDTWELGIHSYLRYLRDRLKVALDLLTDEPEACLFRSGMRTHISCGACSMKSLAARIFSHP